MTIDSKPKEIANINPQVGFPQPAPPPQTHYILQPVPGYATEEGTSTTERRRLPCFGIGIGWVLFILGFFCFFPWYIGALIYVLRRNKLDNYERPGYVACAAFAFIATVIIIALTSIRPICR